MSKYAIWLSLASYCLIASAGITYAQTGWNGPVNLDNTHQRFSGHSTMDFDSNGYIHAASSDFNGGDVRIRYMTNLTGSWVKTDIPTTGVTGARNNCILIVTPDDVMHVFFQGESTGGGPTQSWETTKPVGSGTWSTPLQISHATGGNFDYACADSTGGILATWVTITFGSSGGSNYVRYKPLGGSWGAVEHIDTGYGNKWPSDNFISLDANDNFYICYRIDRPFYRVRLSNGTLGARVELDSGGWDPRVIENPVTGELAATWHNDWRNWISTSTDGGQTWSTKMDMSTTGSEIDRNPISIFDSAGNLHVAWQKSFPGSSDVYFRSRINGTWEAEYSLSPWDIGNAYPAPDSLNARGTELHMIFPADQSPDDYYDIAYMSRPPLEQPATLDNLTLSKPLLIADNSTQYALTVTAGDANGVADILDIRALFNYQGDNSGDYRGYLAWGQTPADIAYYSSQSDWNIAPVDIGTGYWGIQNNAWGALDYLNILSVQESNTGTQRTVSFVFTVKPAYYTDGPLTDNDISGFVRHSDGAVPWQNFDLNFSVTDANEMPTLVDLSMNRDAWIADGSTLHTLTMVGQDGNGGEDIRVMRWLINYQGDHAGDYRGYFSWGMTPEEIGQWGGVENWAIGPATGGEGYYGIRMNGWGTDQYIQMLGAFESHAGNQRTVTFHYWVKPQFVIDGPLAGNDISYSIGDNHTATSWANLDLNFSVFPANMPDYDADGDVDLSDFAIMQRCITGQGGGPVPAGCDPADFDFDSDVDIYDVARLELCTSGPNIPADAGCLDLPIDFLIPDMAYNPVPASGATHLGTFTDLNWSTGTAATSHDVYFGTTNPPPFVGNQAGTTYDPGDLALNTTYFWRIDEVNSLGTTTGAVWSFTTSFNMVDNLNRYVLAPIATGNYYYTDRTYTITAMPASLDGNTGLRTVNDDRYIDNQPEWVTFDLNVAADVYVAYDHRGAPVNGGQLPQWLSDNFTDSGLTMSLSDTYASPFILYKKTYSPGHVVLGSNSMPPADGSNSNYIVIFDPLP